MSRWRTLGAMVWLWLGATAWAVEVPEGRLSLNDASAQQLATLANVGPSLAAAIVELRERRGRLDSVEQLRVLPGVTPDAIDSLRKGTAVRFDLALERTGTFTTPEEVLAQFDAEPDVASVQRWASEYAQVQPELVERWLRASRAFAALPQIRGTYQVRNDYQNDFRRFDEFGNPPTSNDGTFFDVQTDADVGQAQVFSVWASWDLDKIVMSSEQIRVINEAQDIVKLREKLLGEVTQLYFERRRLQVDVLLNPKSDLVGQVRDELRLRELTANIDAYTGGRFSSELGAR
jgi:competence ComEA-like helix-hairpin-helix protein